MVGYIVADKPELKIKEFELYKSYYCGVCKSIARRYGQIPRLVLSYDSAFLAALISSINTEQEEVIQEHCIIHPIKKKNICINNRAVDYAADMMIILAYHKLKDDVNDEDSASAKVMEVLFRRAYKKLNRKYPQVCGIVKNRLADLTKMESENCDSLDRTSDSFAYIMQDVFSFYFYEKKERMSEFLVLKNLGFHIGKWMYVIDAYDDIEQNIQDRNYNPLFYRFKYKFEMESSADFKKRIKDNVEFLLFQYLGEMGKIFDLLSLGKNKGLIDNIIYLGLYRKTEEVLNKSNNKRNRKETNHE